MMSLITCSLLLLLALMYMGSGSKNETIRKLHKTFAPYRELIGYWGFLYGIVGSVLSIVFAGTAMDGFILFATNFLIIFLASPIAYPRLKKHIQSHNDLLDEELEKMVNAANNYGYIMAGIAVILAVLILSSRII